MATEAISETPRKGKLFVKGQPGGPGRPPGPNKLTLGVRQRYAAILEDWRFKRWLRATILSGQASDQLLALVHAYAYGRPVQQIDLGVGEGGSVTVQFIFQGAEPVALPRPVGGRRVLETPEA